jgi:hypothetical protein
VARLGGLSSAPVWAKRGLLLLPPARRAVGLFAGGESLRRPVCRGSADRFGIGAGNDGEASFPLAGFLWTEECSLVGEDCREQRD